MMDHTADSPEKLTPEESEAAAEAKFDCLTPEILEGRKEAAYWADVPVHARYPNQSQKQGEKKSKKRPREEAEVVKKSEAQSVTTEPESGQQHIRFE